MSQPGPAFRRVCPTCGATFADGQFCAHDGTALVPVGSGEPDRVGSRVGNYQIVRLIGEGGMGRVYEARHAEIDKQVAIKVLRNEIAANPLVLARFRQEARSASTLKHDHIVDVSDYGTLPDGAPYIVMEMLEGESLAERMRRGAVSVPEAARIFIELCSGLSVAHARGIVHRDLKPENVFLANRLGGAPRVKILDFGIAKVEGGPDGLSLTSTGAVMGTAHYMSPEQALGKPIDQRADVYAVGVMLYQVFARRPPFDGDSFMAVLSKHLTEPPPRLSSVVPGVPVHLEALVTRALAKDPDGRPASAAELAAELAVIAGAAGREDVAAPPIAATVHAWGGEPPEGRPELAAASPGEDDGPVAPARRSRGWLLAAAAAAAGLALTAGVLRYWPPAAQHEPVVALALPAPLADLAAPRDLARGFAEARRLLDQIDTEIDACLDAKMKHVTAPATRLVDLVGQLTPALAGSPAAAMLSPTATDAKKFLDASRHEDFKDQHHHLADLRKGVRKIREALRD